VECNTELINQGDILRLNLYKSKLKNITQDKEIDFNPIPPIMIKLLDSGGLIAHFKKYKGLKFDV
jgi:3-isopropylmalate/(R)-2-methylmalate dehydratase small subunit